MTAHHHQVDGAGSPSLYLAARSSLGLVALLFALAVAAWWFTVDQMRGMDNGPGTRLGALGWFLGIWVVMMAAMMLPSIWPTVALYSRMTGTRSPAAPLAFVAGYLLIWSAAGLLAFAASEAGRQLAGSTLSWDHGGRWLAGGILVMAALYELTPAKAVCLRHCRTPLGFLLGHWRDGTAGALRMGMVHGAWCLGCCWALMAALFALGIMSIVWMALVTALIAVEKMLPWRRLAVFGVAAILLLLGVTMVVAPEAVPGLTLPGQAPMSEMPGMTG